MKKLLVTSPVITDLAAAKDVSFSSESTHVDELGDGRRVDCVADQLTENQREALTQMIQELLGRGGTCQEVQEAIQLLPYMRTVDWRREMSGHISIQEMSTLRLKFFPISTNRLW
ncbi:MAG: hypothetical protein HXS41_06460 [Theionarchaea archaeon]|nr:hypothetical protein [Theionarchaea archaeon]MBU6999706.1 hypothetical protein [Theionarchaea archaeon]MBU7020682.1 hypothetical protein [Theionarchaea archaeon]MBU7034648.1 hypothetical protein [Theionarchaea archaeon]MBU7039856.1 hypothetical protein [Theionarchaea archaeon]